MTRSRSPRRARGNHPDCLPRHIVAGGRPPDLGTRPGDAPPSGASSSNEAAVTSSHIRTSGATSPPRHTVTGGRPPDSSAVDPPEGVPPVRLTLDGAAFHPSHSFGFHRGVYWCWRCQGVASVLPRKLASPCAVPAGSTYSDRSGGRVRQLSRKQLPSNMKAWPLEEGARPNPDILVINQPH